MNILKSMIHLKDFIMEGSRYYLDLVRFTKNHAEVTDGHVLVRMSNKRNEEMVKLEDVFLDKEDLNLIKKFIRRTKDFDCFEVKKYGSGRKLITESGNQNQLVIKETAELVGKWPNTDGLLNQTMDKSFYEFTLGVDLFYGILTFLKRIKKRSVSFYFRKEDAAVSASYIVGKSGDGEDVTILFMPMKDD